MMILFLLIHILYVIILVFLKLGRRLHSSPTMLILAALIPVFGFFCILSVEMKGRGRHTRIDYSEINHMKIEDDIYRSIHIKPDDGVKETVPVEESLLFNPAVKRRKLLLNVLSQKASDYVSVLRRAGINDDTEVVHYAVTALVELRNEYTLRFDRMEQKMASRRADPRILRDYIDLLEEYIDSGLPEKEERREKLLLYEHLLKEAASAARSTGQGGSIARKRVKCALKLRDYEHAAALSETIISMEPEKEDGYLLKIRCLGALKDRKGIDSVIQRLYTNHVFLSEEGEKVIAFWQPGEVWS